MALIMSTCAAYYFLARSVTNKAVLFWVPYPRERAHRNSRCGPLSMPINEERKKRRTGLPGSGEPPKTLIWAPFCAFCITMFETEMFATMSVSSAY